MVIDHINTILLDMGVGEMYLVGRATFPLFCYAIAVAFMRRKPEEAAAYGFRKYGLRLLVFAALAEPISQITRDVPCLNVLFTLSFGAMLAGAVYKMKDWQVYLSHLAAVLLMAVPSICEFGTAGIALPSAILMIMRGKKSAWISLVALLLTINMGGYISGSAEIENIEKVLSAALLVFFFCSLLPLAVLHTAKVRSQKGRWLPKYFLHVFYPAHLLILWGIGILFLKTG